MGTLNYNPREIIDGAERGLCIIQTDCEIFANQWVGSGDYEVQNTLDGSRKLPGCQRLMNVYEGDRDSNGTWSCFPKLSYYMLYRCLSIIHERWSM